MRESVSYWPAFRDSKPREKTLAIWNTTENYLINEQQETYRPHDYNDLVNYLIATQTDLYANDLIDCHWLDVAVADEKTTVMATPGQNVIGVSAKREKNRTAWIGQARSWFPAMRVGDSFLHALRAVFEHIGYGTYTTPGSLGQRIWRASHIGSPVSRPNIALRKKLLDNLIGGRVDTFETNVRYNTLYEIDMKSAYASMCTSLPYGTATRIMAGSVVSYATWYCECKITIPFTLPFGPFAIRKDSLHNSYPDQPGTYRAWIWRNEYERALQAGCSIDILSGWGWDSMDNRASIWANEMQRLRVSAPEYIADVVKKCIVAAIGRHGMQPYSYELIDYTIATEEDLSVLSQGEHPITNWYLRKKEEKENSNLTHWYAYIMAACRCALYDRMLAEKEAGNRIIASNYDAIYLEKATTLKTGHALGDWKQTALTNATIPYARAITSLEKTRLPGTMLLNHTVV